ncbi:hypothetical protein Bpfe_003475, partial [Biomphalaria pfeifferi]
LHFTNRQKKMIKVPVCRVMILVLTFSRNGFSALLNGESLTICATFKHMLTEDLEVVWLRNDDTVSQCSIRGGCLDDFQDKTNTSLRYDKETGLASCNVTIKNATRDDLGTWTLKYLGTAGVVYTNDLFACGLYDDENKSKRRTKECIEACSCDRVNFNFDLLPILLSSFLIVLVLAAILLYKYRSDERCKKILKLFFSKMPTKTPAEAREHDIRDSSLRWMSNNANATFEEIAALYANMCISTKQMSICQCSFIPILLSIVFYKEVFSESAALNATLSDFILQDGNTKCERYFLINDTIELKASIVWTRDINLDYNDGILIYKYSDSNASFKLLYHLRFHQCKGLHKSLPMSCSFSNSSAEAQLRLTATKTYSQKYIRLHVNNTKNAWESNVRQIPRIFEYQDIKMTCNNKTLGGNVTSVYLPNETTELHVCCVDAPDPCFPVIYSYFKDSSNKSRTCVTYTRKQNETTFLIGLDVCNNSVQYPFKVFFSNETETITTTTGNGIQSNDTELILGLSLGLGIPAVFLILAIVVYKRCNNNENHDENEEHEMDDMMNERLQSIEKST